MKAKIIDNCCSLEYLDYLKRVASKSDNWSLRYPVGKEISIEKKFLKLDIINNGIRHPFLAGLAMGLLLQIHKACDQDLFIPEPYSCGISIKDKHRIDNLHTDKEKGKEDKAEISILGIINSDWKEEWGGSFFHNGTSYYIKPTSFCIFDASELHAAEEIFTDNKRFAIDFAVFRNQQALEKMIKE